MPQLFLDHLILHCEKLVNTRNELFCVLVDLLLVNDLVILFEQNEDDLLITLFGGDTDFVDELNSDTWKQMMFGIACQLFKMYNDFQVVSLLNTFHFGQKGTCNRNLQTIHSFYYVFVFLVVYICGS